MARELSIEQLGIYGLLTGSISYCLYIVGLDYYTYTTRELMSQPKENWSILLRDQVTFYIITYALTLPIFLILFTQQLLPWKMLLPFYGLLAIEHISQELYRILVAIQKPLLASISLFFRLGAWIYAIFIYTIILNFSVSLNLIFTGWSIGGLLSIMLGLVYLHKAIDWSRVKKQRINWTAILNGLRVSSHLLVSTLALRTLFTFDRYFIEWYVSTESVGVYTFYSSLVNGISGFIDAGVIVFQAPQIVKSYKLGNMVEFNKAKAIMQRSIIIALIILCGLSLIIINPLLHFISKETFIKDISIYYWLLLATIFLSLSNISHYELYAKDKDRHLMFSGIVTLVVFCSGAYILMPHFGSEGVAISMASSMIVMFIFKHLSKKHTISKITNSNR
jgi:O-antigen/teichoic acid export membrane protein